jgi:hypothetical protein
VSPRANPAKVEDFGGARDQEKWPPVFRPITHQLRISITFYPFRSSRSEGIVIYDLLSDIDLARILIGEVRSLRLDTR